MSVVIFAMCFLACVALACTAALVILAGLAFWIAPERDPYGA
jgi:hypothetical protein